MNYSSDPYIFPSHSAGETQSWAERLAELLLPGDVLALEGDLGAGKTTFTQGLARALGVKGVVNSPTFTLIKEYQGRMPLYHMDVYRVDDEFEELGFDEYFYGEGVTVVEWASRIPSLLPSELLSIYIKRLEGDSREIHLYPKGERFQRMCEELKT
ncbi:tRNA (adenosine(37)-N6)-threonylcarbamoyltransferase complex ATPase subunit type 1 TsaE [Ammoniphilus sp. YIM 78166]|uniref:tRNA (adenosine(37)-N6)-threonylcarbamoyltransferase complex ATPase subunit type 1 TsaE n=1 Tax=Ammoniphilus sp. YIM 78166 TaxID=1644106 RepID=UPI001F114A2B|nr:tRNA (adenosine(37)-N6)-threonylcarbamoyltransferase complex ATPase subunit type 1 TsaE [Ammoniphilus sp. YIM 78166]